MKHIEFFINERLKISSKEPVKKWNSIEDANNGDIITMSSPYADKHKIYFIFIFKKIEYNKVKIHGYYYSCSKTFNLSSNPGDFIAQKETNGKWDHEFSLSTKEEQEIFFDAMNKAGYKWDQNKKEIKKI